MLSVWMEGIGVLECVEGGDGRERECVWWEEMEGEGMLREEMEGEGGICVEGGMGGRGGSVCGGRRWRKEW